MATYSPSRLIAAPELWVPGKRYFGPVRLNKQKAHEFNIIAAWYFLEGVGSLAFDLTGSHHGTLAGTTLPTWDSQNGLNFDVNGTNTRLDLGSIDSSNPISGATTGMISAYSIVNRRSAAYSFFPRFIDKSNSGSGSGGWSWNMYRFSTSDVQEFYINASVVRSTASDAYLDGYDEDRSFGVSTVENGGTLNFFYRGELIESTTSPAKEFPTTTTNAAIGNWNHSTDRSLNGTMSVLLLSDQFWTEDQHARIDADPYMFLEPDLPEWILVGALAAASGGTVTASLDGILKKQGTTLAASLDGILKKQGTTLAASLDAALQQTAQAQTSLNAALQQSLSSATSLDAAVKASLSQGTNLDAAIQTALIKTTSLDGIIQQAQTATANLDAAIQEAMTVTTQFDAFVQGGGAGAIQAALDAALQASQSITTSLDAALQISDTGAVSMDALLAAAQSQTANLDAIIQKTSNLVTTSLGAVLLQSQSIGALLDAVILAGLTFSIDAIVQKTGLTITMAIDAVIDRGCVELTNPETAAAVISALTDPESAAVAMSITDPEDTAKPLC